MDESFEKHRDLMERIAKYKYREDVNGAFERINNDLNRLDEIFEELQEERVRVFEYMDRIDKLEENVKQTINEKMLKKTMLMHIIYKREKDDSSES